MSPSVMADLATADGVALRAHAGELLEQYGELAAVSRLRQTFPAAAPELVSAAVTQAVLQRRAVGRLGGRAAGLLLTADGLAQATRPVVADRRAERIAAAGYRHVADLGCGLGLDAQALLSAGLQVDAVELDPVTAAAARANLAGRHGAVVWQGDVTDPAVLAAAVRPDGVVFVDPARRDPAAPRAVDGRSARRVMAPDRWSPPWSWVRELAASHPATVAKVAPGIDRAAAPAGAEVAWTSVDGDVVEACVWFPALAEPGVRRRAVVIDHGVAHQLTSAEAVEVPAPVGPVGPWLVEPDGAVLRAGLVAEAAATVGGRLVNSGIGYVCCDDEPVTAWGTAYRVVAPLPSQLRALRNALRQRGFGDVVVKKRGVAIVPEQVRATLRLGGAGPTATLVFTRTPTGPLTLLVERAPTP
ncbi:MAG: SAM-dependent methyltransferase [Actinomycetota bacterium]|nr:MAG: SAM-dependent methyltransferase [Actinomycetota bacterium]